MKQESIMSRLFRMISINSEPQENTETEENPQEENLPPEAPEQPVPAAEPQSAEQAPLSRAAGQFVRSCPDRRVKKHRR